MAGATTDRESSYDPGVQQRYTPLAGSAYRPYFGKRFLDVVCASVALIVVGPALLLLALLVKITSKGPAFFRQVRVSRGGREFLIYKLRSMSSDEDDGPHKEYTKAFIEGNLDSTVKDGGGNEVYKLVDDHRVTNLGRWLRKTSLDELPQLINVLKGDMSLVGPRPHTRYEVELYQEWHRGRLEGTPGMTGWWQVSGRSAVKFDESVEMDLWYLEHQSFWLDVRILGMTLACVFRGAGAY